MVDSPAFSLIIGAALGFLSGLGIGGGSLLLLYLTVVLEMAPSAARSINLLFFLPSAAIACCFRWKQGCIRWKTVLPAAVGGCISAAVCSVLGTALDTGLLRKLFGGLLILTGLRELFTKPKA